MNGFCSIDIGHGNLSQKRKSSIVGIAQSPGAGAGGGGGGFEFLSQIGHKLKSTYFLANKKEAIPSVRTLDP